MHVKLYYLIPWIQPNEKLREKYLTDSAEELEKWVHSCKVKKFKHLTASKLSKHFIADGRWHKKNLNQLHATIRKLHKNNHRLDHIILNYYLKKVGDKYYQYFITTLEIIRIYDYIPSYVYIKNYEELVNFINNYRINKPDKITVNCSDEEMKEFFNAHPGIILYFE